MIVYKITNKINGKIYIGATTRLLRDRWNQHFWKSSKKMLIYSDLQKYGKDNFFVEELGKYIKKEDLSNAETYFIEFYNCIHPYGYNRTSGGLNFKHHSETKRKMALSALGEKNHNFGKKRSLESRIKQSLKTKGRPLSEAHKQALRKPKSEEHKMKLRKNLKQYSNRVISMNNE